MHLIGWLLFIAGLACIPWAIYEHLFKYGPAARANTHADAMFEE